jgi:citrate synthase
MKELTEFSLNRIQVRGGDIRAMIQSMTFVDAVIWMLEGQHSDLDTAKMINGLLVAWIDHGKEPPSTKNVRNAASVEVDFASATIAGLATFGGKHVPIRDAAIMLKEVEVRSEQPLSQVDYLRSLGIVPGFGHPVHSCDPRVAPLLKLAADHVANLRYCQALHDAESILAAILTTDDPPKPNLAGVTAAIWLDLGFDLDTVELIPIIGRTVGWAAHYAEQRSQPPFEGSRI